MPRPRLVCRLRPIGRSSGVPDKSSQSLGNMSRYSAQILICLIAYIVQFLIPLWVWLGTLQNCHHVQSPLPLSIAIKLRLLIRQSNFPSCLAEVQQHETLSGNYATELMKLTDKLDEICINGKLTVQEPSAWRVLLHTCEQKILYFSPESGLTSGMLELGQLR